MTRIAYICADPGIPVFGSKGASIHVQEMLRALLRRGFDPVLFAVRLDGDVPADLEQVQVWPLPALPAGNPALRERSALEVNTLLPELLAAFGPFALVYERYSLWSYAAMEYARAAGIAGVLEVNAPLIEEQQRHRVLVDHESARRSAERAFAAARSIVAVSPAVAAYVATFPGTADRVHVEANGIDPARFPGSLCARRRYPSADEPFVVGFLGSLKAWHGVELLVEAFARAYDRDRGLRLLIVGDGPMRAEIEAAVASRDLGDAVRLTGAVPMDEVPALLAEMDVGVAPYPQLPDFYFSPLKIVEYMAAGLATITSRVSGLEEMVEHEVTGLLYAPDDAEALAAAILRLRGDAKLSRRLGTEGRRRVLAGRTWDRIADRILNRAGLEEVCLS